jgi:hypothetical protein
MRNLILILILFPAQIFSQNFTYSGYLYNANGSGASNVPVKLYRRINSSITGFSSQTNYNGHSYYRSNSSAYWLDAKTACENMGGHLATVSSSSENSFLYNTWPSGWIGYYQDKTGAFYSEPSGGWRWTEKYVTTGQINNYDVASYSSGTTLSDLTSSKNMTLYNSPGYASSGGKYLTFNGSNNYAITPSLSSYFSNSNTITLILWVYPTGNGVIVDELGTPSTSSGWHESVVEITGGNTLRCGFWNGSGITQVSTSITLNQWCMIAVKYNGSTMTAYKNGVSFGSSTFYRQTPHLNGGGDEVFALGLADATNMGSGSYGAFRLGAFQIYNASLSDDEINRCYMSLSYRFGINPYLSWNGGEPNNSGSEDYAQFVSGGLWNDLPNNVSLPYVIEFDYIVTTSSWALYKTAYTNSSGYYSFNETSDPSKEYYIQIDAPNRIQTFSMTDGQNIGNVVLGNTTKDGITFLTMDLNNDNKITVADQYYLFARKSNRFGAWRNIPDTRLYTVSEYNSIKASSTNLRSTYPGVISYSTTTLTSGGTLNYYIIAPGYSGQVTY